MGKNEQHYESSISGPPHMVDGPGCVPVAVGAFLATSGLCAARSHDRDGTQLYCNKELAHVAMGDPWHNMVSAGTLGREAAERVLCASGALERDRDAFLPCTHPRCGKSPIAHIGLILGHQYVEPK